jgi:two-component system CheB/CheR fusion protein
VRVRVEAVDPTGKVGDGWLVAFEPDEMPGDPLMDDGAAKPGASHRPPLDELLRERVNALESELRTARQNLQVTVEEMETSNEELQATNEELIASNEELQSTNEELHSVNEELYTVNAEYQAKINELTELTADVNNLLEGTDVHTLFLDKDLRIRKFTPRIGETFNLLPQDVGRRFETFAHSLRHDGLIEEVRRVLAEQRTVECEVAAGDGSHFFMRILPYSGREEAGGVVLTLIDISALKRAQHELAVSEERYRTLLRSITAVFFTADAEGRFAVAQPEWEAYTGQSWDEHRGEGWLAAFHPEDRAAVRSRWHEASDGRQAFEVEARIHSRSEGDYRWSVVRAAPLTGDGNRIREWVGHVADIHERRVAETAVRRHEKQIAAIVANSPAFIWVKDPSGRYLLAGQQAQALYGVPADELIGKTDYDAMPLADADRARGMERQVLEQGQTAESEETRVLDGEERTFLTSRFALRDDRGVVYALAGITTDVTERKRTVEEAQDAVVRRDRFLAMLSHELRTPLGAILNASNLLSRQLEDRPGPGLEIIRRQARHMARLIDDLLDIGRVTRDELNIERVAVDLSALVREVVDGIRPAMDDAGLSLNLDLPSDGPLCVRGDSVRLRQIVTNLLNNALSYTPRGGRVSVRGAEEDGRAVIAVRDTGVGMNPDEMDRIFELFYQAPQSIDRPRGGLGIGLTLAQRLAQVHGGEITAESAGRGYGSTFRASFPLMNSAEAREALSAPSGRPAHKLRIAIVEDNADIRETLRDLLLLEGHEVFPAEDGKDGLDLVLRERPDLALVDVGLPRLDGYEVARRIKAACGAGIRVVALTGYGRQEDRLKAVEAGFDEHFVKPVEVEALSRLLADVEARKHRKS